MIEMDKERVKFGLSTKPELEKLINHLKLNIIVNDRKPTLNVGIGQGLIFDVFSFGSNSPNIGHWGLLKRLSNDSVILIDSYGVYHQSLIDELKKYYKNILIVLDQQQNMSSQSCGYYCILNYYLLERGLYNPYAYILIQDNNYIINDKKINVDRYDTYENIYNHYGL